MARPRKAKKDQLDLPMHPIADASLAEEAQRRYLTYALSVITARALPDVRDGLKPVQRRILYTMQNELHLRHGVKHRKSAAIVGDVMGKFHPHGDSAIYEALVRMAQSFTMRAPLVDGRGNFGSPDGDAAAAMRYTEARLGRIADELMLELGSKTVPFRPNYDGTRFEPVVLPARFPNLLVNGSQGIAVGMATSIPPHNLGEVVDACIALIDDRDLALRSVLKYIKGPDFPTGGQLLSSRSEIHEAYKTGQGSFRLRGEWSLEDPAKGNPQIVITSIPYSVERRAVVEQIGNVIIERKLPLLLDVRDESTDVCRVVCEIKRGADPQLVMAYLYKHTPLTSNVQVNLVALVPTANADVAAPDRLDLVQMLRHFLDFRMGVVTKRIEFELQQLRERIHILRGFEIIFDALDETIRIIRKSDGREDAAEKLMARFKLDEIQVTAILELRLYRLARLEILLIQKELEEKRTEAAKLEKLLKSKDSRWKLIRTELEEIKTNYPDKRRTQIMGEVDEPEYSAEAFIVEEDSMVILTQQGWVKRQKGMKDVGATRVREGDAVSDVQAGSTRASMAFFSNFGVCYVSRIADIPATSGYGVPAQTLFKMEDGERIVAAMSFDARFLDVPAAKEGADEPDPPYAIAVTKQGMGLRFSLRGHRDPSTRSGRKFARPRDGDEVVYVGACSDKDQLAVATKRGRALICTADDVALLSGAGRGVMVIKVAKDDELLGARLLTSDDDALTMLNDSGRSFEISTRKYEVVSRGGKGFTLFKRGELSRVDPGEPTLPGVPSPDAEGDA